MRNIAVIFDMDGLLLDTERMLMGCFLETTRARGLPDAPEVYLKTLGTNREATIQIYGDHFGSAELGEELLFDALGRVRARANVSGVPVMPGAPELLEFLHARGCRIALASSNTRAHIDELLEAAGLLHYFEAIVSGDTVAVSKPHPEIYLRAFAALHAPELPGYAVEDAPNGVRSAHAAGLMPILVPDMVQPDDAVRKLAHRVFPSLHEARVYFASIL